MSNQESLELVEERYSRLENIQTRWSQFRTANRQTDDQSQAMHAFVLRYAGPIRAYVLAIVRDDNLADELAQEAVIRLIQGDFSGADPNRGRFRDLLKTSLRNMVRNYWRKSNRETTKNLDLDDAEEQEEHQTPDTDPWLAEWRKHLLDLAWADLERKESLESDQFAYSTLQVKIENPEANSTELARILGDRINKTIKPDGFRQKLKRARKLLIEFLIDEIREGLENPTIDRVHDELIVLGLYEWVKKHIDDT